MNDSQKWATDQLTKEQAIAIHDSKIWETWSDEEIVRGQLFQKRMYIPFDRFHKAMKTVLKRPVFTHEFALRDSLVLEYLGKRETPMMQEIIDLIPAEKRVIIGI